MSSDPAKTTEEWPWLKKKNKKDNGGQKSEVEWIGAGVHSEGGQIFYSKAILQGDLAVSVGNTVLLEPCDQISNMFDGPEGATAHLIWYCWAANTVFSWTEDDMEIFQWPDCQDGPLLSIAQRCKVLCRQELPGRS